MSKRGIIVSGGSIDDSFALDMLEKINPDVIIGVDSGLAFLYRNQVTPTHIVGDFDSVNLDVIEYYRTETDVPVRQFNPVKDASDTEIAVRLAIELGVNEMWMLGATGTRLDHVMANIQVLKIPHDAGVKAYIVDSYNRISLVEKEIWLEKEKAFGPYFSVFPLGGIVPDFCIDGAKYPLKNFELCPYDSRCVSNQYLEEKVHITFPDGIIILMETRDGNQSIEISSENCYSIRHN